MCLYRSWFLLRRINQTWMLVLLTFTSFLLSEPTGLTTLMLSKASARGSLSAIHETTSWTRLMTCPLNRPTPRFPVSSSIFMTFITHAAIASSCCSSSLICFTSWVEFSVSVMPWMMSDLLIVMDFGSGSSIMLFAREYGLLELLLHGLHVVARCRCSASIDSFPQLAQWCARTLSIVRHMVKMCFLFLVDSGGLSM
jgi:hypothetical protein